MVSRVLTLMLFVMGVTSVAGLLFQKSGRPLPSGKEFEPICTKGTKLTLEKIKQYARDFKPQVQAKADYVATAVGIGVEQVDNIAPPDESQETISILTYELKLAGGGSHWLCSIAFKKAVQLLGHQKMSTTGQGASKEQIYAKVFNEFLDKIINYVKRG